MKKAFLPFLLMILLFLAACSPRAEEQGDYIGIEAAKAAALTDAGLPADAPADFSAAGLGREDGEEFYAVNFTLGGASYQYQIHPVTGKVLRANSQGPRLIGEEAAREIAIQHAGLAPDQVTLLPIQLEIEEGRQVYDVEFYTAEYAEYDYEIDAITGEIVSFDQEIEHPLTSAVSGTGTPLGLEGARSAALVRSGLSEKDVTFTQAELDREHGRDLYEFEFRTADGTEYECEVVALTGEVIYFECDREHSAGPTDPGRPLLSHEEAKAIALRHAGLTEEEASFAELDAFVDFDWEDGRQICEVRFSVTVKSSYKYDIDAHTGEIVKYSEEHIPFHPSPMPPGPGAPIPSKGPVTADEAKSIALNQVPGASVVHITDFEGDYDDDTGRLKFEVEIRYNGMEYDFEIDSADGTILEYEADPID